MNLSVKWKLALGLTAVIVAGTAAGATAKVLRHAIFVTKSHHPQAVVAAAQPRKTCWRYYGGPKGGMWPGDCSYY
jgi:hypothetical protein